MNRRTLLILLLLGLFLAACQAEMTEEPRQEPTAEEGESVAVTRVVTETVVEEEEEVEDPAEEPVVGEEAEEEPPVETPPAPTTAPTPIATQEGPPATVPALEHVAELEWPPRMRLGESDVVRLALLPAEDGYVVTADFPEHRTVTETVALEQLAGYDVVAAARLDGVGFDLSPAGERQQDWRPGRALSWRWTISPRQAGQQRLSVALTVHWRPEPGRSLPSRQATVFSRGLDVQVVSLLGLTRNQAVAAGVLGLVLGVALLLPALKYQRSREDRSRNAGPRDTGLQPLPADPALVLEPHPAVALDDQEQALLRSLFHDYSRVTIEREFQSGYSGARTFLALPIRADGRSDAYTIAKLGDRDAILREYENYESYVEHTLPPITARIQGRPVTVAGWRAAPPKNGSPWAALRYTFIGEPGRQPLSLRQALRQALQDERLAAAGPALLETLFRTFGPNWWMQRSPYTFRLALEYDRKLPAHYVVAPVSGRGAVLDGRTSPFDAHFDVDDCVQLHHFSLAERKDGGQRLTLQGEAQPGHPPLRLHWLSADAPDGAIGRVVATRYSLLQQWTSGFDGHGLPDPLAPLPSVLAQSISGSRSVIHGDLNLENALIGPGDFVWLIDFARTGEGHTLYDFAHLGAELIAHVLPARLQTSFALLDALEEGSDPLLGKVEELAHRCLFDSAQPREYKVALYLSCLGALKHSNLDERARHFLYLTAAHLVRSLAP